MGWLYGPFGNPLDDELAGAAAKELADAAGELAEGAGAAADMIGNDFWRAVATHRPEVAGLFGYSMQSIGDGGSYLGEIVETDEHNGTRSVQIDHPVHGRMTIRQEQDRTTERYRNLDVTFVDPETGEEITEKLPSSRFFVRAE